jgi:hypothetical protein
MLESSIRITAIAQKAGIGDVAGTYTDALSGGFDKFAELPNNIKGALMRFGQGDSALMEDIMAGRGMQEKNLRKIAEGMKMDTRSVLGLDLMTADLKKVYGMGIGDLQKMVQTMDEGSRTITERIKKAEGEAAKDEAALAAQRASGVISEEQYTKMLADRQAQLATQIKDLQLTDISKTLNETLGDAAKKGGAAFSESVIEAGRKNAQSQFDQGKISRQQLNEMLSDQVKLSEMGSASLQSGFATAAQDVETKMRAALEAGTMEQAAFDTAMAGFDPKSLTSELESAMAAGDTSKVAELQQKLVDMQQTADAQGMKGTNVVDKIENHVAQINAKIRDMFSDGLIGLLEKLGAVAIIMTMIGATIVTAIAGLGVVLTTMLGPARMLKLGSAIGGRLARPLAALKGVFRGGKGGGRVAGMAVTRGGLGSAASRSKGLARANRQLARAGAEFGQATKGMRTAVGNFGTSVKTTVKNSKAWTKSAQVIDGAGQRIARGVAGAKGRLAGTGTKIAARAGQARTFVAGKLDDAGKGIARGVRAAKGSKLGVKVAATSARVGKGLATTGRVLNGVGKASVTAARGLGTALKAAGSWTVVLPIAISAIEGFAGAMMAGAKAHEIFGVAQDETTERMRMAAEGAGIFTGILDGLTFGLFNKWLGPTGSVTEALAKFMHTFWPLALVLQSVLLPFKILWGVLKGLWMFLKNAFIGLWEGLKMAVEPVIDIFNILWDAVSEIGSVFTDLFDSLGIFGDTGSGLPSIVDVISGALGMLGTALGWVFKAIGFVIKMGLMPLVFAIKWIVKPIVWLIKTALTPVIWAIKKVAKAFIWLYDAMVRPVIDAVKGIFKWFHDLYMWLVGGSLIPDMIMGIFKWFLKLPGLIFKAIWKIPSMIITALLSIPKMLANWASNMFSSLGLDGLASYFGAAADAFGAVIDIVKGIF